MTNTVPIGDNKSMEKKKKKFEVVVSMSSYHTFIVEAHSEGEAQAEVMSGQHDAVEIEPTSDFYLEEINPLDDDGVHVDPSRR